MHVVFVVLDAFPNHRVDAVTTPVLWDLIQECGWNPQGGIAELTAATYPNHATFVTGASAPVHGIITNRVWHDDRWTPSTLVGPAVPTLFDAMSAVDRSSGMVVGDQYLLGVCGGGAAGYSWPPGGEIPEGAARNATGYIADEVVVDTVHSLDVRDYEFLFVQLDSVDAARHMFGAESDAAVEQCTATDAALGAVLEAYRPFWEDTVVVAVSDHDQEDVGPQDPIDLAELLGDRVRVQNQGTASLVVGDIDDAELLAIPGVTGLERVAAEHRVVWGDDGQHFSSRAPVVLADHGSPRTRTQVAVVAGGHPAAKDLAHRVAARRPAARDWAGWVADLLALDWPADASAGQR